MRKKLALIATSLVIVGAAWAQSPVPAPSPKPSIDARQAQQEQRIQQGLQSGRLTPAEAARLQKGEARIDAAQARAQTDGKLTKREQSHLDNMTQREDHAIYKQKHDRQNDRNHDGQRDHRRGGHQKK